MAEEKDNYLIEIPKDGLGNYLEPVEGNKYLAALNEETANYIFETGRRGDDDLIRLGKVYFGRYGIFGYIESRKSMNTKRPRIWEILEIPKSLWEGIGEVKGLQGYIKDYFFENKELEKEDLDHPNIRDLSLFDDAYYWVWMDEIISTWPKLADHVNSMEDSIERKITEIESKLDTALKPEKIPDDFSVLTSE